MTRKSRIVPIALSSGEDEDILLLEQVAAEAETPSAIATEADYPSADEHDEYPQHSDNGRHIRDWLLPAICLLTVTGWTGFFIWAHRFDLEQLSSPQVWTQWISQWSLPVLLVAVAWLLALRTSRREAARFADVSRLLADESARLENRLITVNSELSIARNFIASQSRDLESLGRRAGERLSEHASQLETLIGENGKQVETIAQVSTTALDNMEKLRGQLPVIASSARDVTNHIGNAGRTAHVQLQEMMQGFKRLNEFGLASEQHVGQLREQIAMALAEFTSRAERMEEISNASFSGLSSATAAFHQELDRQHAEAAEAMRRQSQALGAELEASRQKLREQEQVGLEAVAERLAGLDRDYGAFAARLANGEAAALEGWRGAIARVEKELGQVLATLEETDRQAMETAHGRLSGLIAESERLDSYIAERTRLFSEEMERRSSESEEREQADIAAMQQRLAMLDSALTSHASRQQEHAATLSAHGETLAERLGELEQRLQAIADQGADATTGLNRSMHILDENLAACRAVLRTADEEIAAATDSSVRLLELIQASVQQGRDDLPLALSHGEEVLQSFEQRLAELLGSANQASAQGEALSRFTEEASNRIGTARQSLDSLTSGLDGHGARHQTVIEQLQSALSELEARSAGLIARSQSELGAAMAQLASSADATAAAIRTQSEATLSALSGSVEEEVRAALDRAIADRLAEVSGELESATQRAATSGRESILQLRDNLAKVNELAGNLEQRVSQARQRAEEQVDNDFARRVALITETLNSNAIDIVRALDSEVTDTAWASYLKGDRGIFTRRAVKLLETGEARPIAQLFEADPDFREQVSRYIHDFENMLRQVLSTRDGNAMGVTLLSSDMGKLYVALAQAIERFRS